MPPYQPNLCLKSRLDVRINFIVKARENRNLNQNAFFEKNYTSLERILQRTSLSLTVFSTKKN